MPDISEEGKGNHAARLIFTLLNSALDGGAGIQQQYPIIQRLKVIHFINLHIYKALGINTQEKLDDLKPKSK